MKNTINNPLDDGEVEQLFKEAFEHFEADVSPQVWANVQSGLSSVGGSAVSATANFAIGKIVAGVVAIAGIAGSVWYFSASDNQSQKSQVQSLNPEYLRQVPSSNHQSLIINHQSSSSKS